jgi:hypothetical protein
MTRLTTVTEHVLADVREQLERDARTAIKAAMTIPPPMFDLDREWKGIMPKRPDGKIGNQRYEKWIDEFAGMDFAKFEAQVLAMQEPKPMFSKQHYESVAQMLNRQRRTIRANGMITDADRQIELRALNDVVMGFVAMFKKDQAKFRELLFIGACDNDAPAVDE